jgi:hypothetical protein
MQEGRSRELRYPGPMILGGHFYWQKYQTLKGEAAPLGWDGAADGRKKHKMVLGVLKLSKLLLG